MKSRGLIIGSAVLATLLATSANAALVAYQDFNTFTAPSVGPIGPIPGGITVTFGSGITAANTSSIAGSTVNIPAGSIGTNTALRVRQGVSATGDYLDASFSTAGFTDLVFTLAAAGGPAADIPTFAAIQYSLDNGGSFLTPSLGAGSSANPLSTSTNFALYTYNFGSVLDNAANVVIRLTLSHSATDVNSRVDVDNFQVNGTSAVPLPAAAWLLMSGIAGVGAFARRRRQAAV